MISQTWMPLKNWQKMKTKRVKNLAIVCQMIDIYYKGNPDEDHDKDELKSYVKKRLEAGPHGDDKPFCSTCKIHCYDKKHRSIIKKVMRYAGPRMLFKSPISLLAHTLAELRSRKS